MKLAKIFALLLVYALLAAACGSSDDVTVATVTVATPEDVVDQVAESEPSTDEPAAAEVLDEPAPADEAVPAENTYAQRVVSLSPTATETLFEIGAGDLVVAVDDQSNYPVGILNSDLSAFTPNVEAIAGFEPDLVVLSFDPGGIQDGLTALGIEVLMQGTAVDLDDAYSQIEQLGSVTGHIGEAAELVGQMLLEIGVLAERAAMEGAGGTFFHEIDNTLYSLTSATFAGQIYALAGLTNLADAVDPDGEFFGYPQLSQEYIIEQDPDFIFLADAAYGESVETVAARPGWEILQAVQGGRVIPLDADTSSRWGPRIPEFLSTIIDVTVGASAE